MSDMIDDVDVVEDIPPRTIRFPKFSLAGKDYDHVVLNPPTAQALDEAEAKPTGIGGTIHLIHRSSGLPQAVCLLLRPQVLHFANRYFGRFTPPAPKAGGDGSPPA